VGVAVAVGNASIAVAIAAETVSSMSSLLVHETAASRTTPINANRYLILLAMMPTPRGYQLDRRWACEGSCY